MARIIWVPAADSSLAHSAATAEYARVSTYGITNPTNARLVLADSARARRLAT